MKILHVIPSVDPRSGGPIEGVRQMGLKLIDMGHSVEVACLDAAGETFVNEFPLRVHALGPSKGGYRYCPALVPWLERFVTQYDAVIVDGLWQYNGFGTWRALRRSRVPYFVFPHGMNDPWFKSAYPLKHMKKWLYWPWAEYRVLRDAAAVIFTCEEERLRSREPFWLYRCNEEVTAFGTVLPPQNGEALRQEFFSRYPDLVGTRIALFLGRIHEKKGCDILVDAFTRLAADRADARLVLVGPDDSDHIRDFLHLAQSRGVGDRVTWLGMLTGSEKWAAFHAAEVFVLPSHQENFGIAVAEAMGCSKPVLISNKVNIWREIEAGGGGLVEDDTLAGTSSLLTQWWSMDAGQLQHMGEKALKTFHQKFTVSAMAEDVLRILAKYAHSTEK